MEDYEGAVEKVWSALESQLSMKDGAIFCEYIAQKLPSGHIRCGIFDHYLFICAPGLQLDAEGFEHAEELGTSRGLPVRERRVEFAHQVGLRLERLLDMSFVPARGLYLRGNFTLPSGGSHLYQMEPVTSDLVGKLLIPNADKKLRVLISR